MGIKFTQSIKMAKVFASSDAMEGVVREIRATMERIRLLPAVAVPGGCVVPVQRYPLNRRCGLDPMEYIAA